MWLVNFSLSAYWMLDNCDVRVPPRKWKHVTIFGQLFGSNGKRGWRWATQLWSTCLNRIVPLRGAEGATLRQQHYCMLISRPLRFAVDHGAVQMDADNPRAISLTIFESRFSVRLAFFHVRFFAWRVPIVKPLRYWRSGCEGTAIFIFVFSSVTFSRNLWRCFTKIILLVNFQVLVTPWDVAKSKPALLKSWLGGG